MSCDNRSMETKQRKQCTARGESFEIRGGMKNSKRFFGFSSLLQQSSTSVVPLSLDALVSLSLLILSAHLLGSGAAGTAGLGLLRSGRRPEGLRAHGCR